VPNALRNLISLERQRKRNSDWRDCVRPAWAWTNEVKVLCRKITVEHHVVIRRQLLANGKG